jgi:hypothetical protein
MLVGNEKKTAEGKGSLLHFCVYAVNIPCAQLLLALGASIDAEGSIAGRSKNGGDNLTGLLEGTALEMVKQMPQMFTSKGTTKKLMFRVTQAGVFKSLLIDAEAIAESSGKTRSPAFEPFPLAPLPPQALAPRLPKAVKKVKKIIKKKVVRLVAVNQGEGSGSGAGIKSLGAKKRPQKENADSDAVSPSKRVKPSTTSFPGSHSLLLVASIEPKIPSLPPGPFSPLSPEFLAVQSAVVRLFMERRRDKVCISSDVLPFVASILSSTQFAEQSKDSKWVETGLKALEEENRVFIAGDELHSTID